MRRRLLIEMKNRGINQLDAQDALGWDRRDMPNNFVGVVGSDALVRVHVTVIRTASVDICVLSNPDTMV